MTKKAAGKLAIMSRAVMAKASTLKQGDVLSLGTIAGVSSKFKLRHTDVGSGVVLFGDFVVRTMEPSGPGAEPERKEQQVQAIILPMDLGSKVAKQLKKCKKPVKFCLNATIKGSEVMVSGFTISAEWIQEPVELGQIDLVRDLLEKSEQVAQSE